MAYRTMTVLMVLFCCYEFVTTTRPESFLALAGEDGDENLYRHYELITQREKCCSEMDFCLKGATDNDNVRLKCLDDWEDCMRKVVDCNDPLPNPYVSCPMRNKNCKLRRD